MHLLPNTTREKTSQFPWKLLFYLMSVPIRSINSLPGNKGITNSFQDCQSSNQNPARWLKIYIKKTNLNVLVWSRKEIMMSLSHVYIPILAPELELLNLRLVSFDRFEALVRRIRISKHHSANNRNIHVSQFGKVCLGRNTKTKIIGLWRIAAYVHKGSCQKRSNHRDITW